MKPFNRHVNFAYNSLYNKIYILRMGITLIGNPLDLCL